jgi:hypothetical protein
VSDQQIPPEMLAQLAQNGGAAVDPDAQKAHDAATALLDALKANAGYASMAGGSAGEAKDFAAACLSLAQAIVVLDPNLAEGGIPLDHQLEMERTRGANQVALEQTRGANALEQAKAQAAAPTPARSIQVKRDGSGRATSYEQR